MGARAFGPGVVAVVGVAGGVLAFTPLNAYVAGTSRLAYALARSGDLPQWTAALYPTRKVPHRALIVLGAACLAALVVAYLRNIHPGKLREACLGQRFLGTEPGCRCEEDEL